MITVKSYSYHYRLTCLNQLGYIAANGSKTTLVVSDKSTVNVNTACGIYCITVKEYLLVSPFLWNSYGAADNSTIIEMNTRLPPITGGAA